MDVGLEQLTTLLYKMGEVAKKTMDLSIRGFMTGKDCTEDVREFSDILVSMTAEIEEKSFGLIVKFQPVASDLRIINSYMKIAYDFERYGRYAWDISDTYKKLGGIDNFAEPSAIMSQLAKEVSEMVRNSVEALRQNNPELAKALAEKETKLDRLFLKYMDQLTSTPSVTKEAVRSLLLARFLERIADHTTYVGESVVYIATGEKVVLR